VDEKKVMTAAELEQLPLEERQRIAAEAIVTDVSQVPTEFLDRARQRGRELLEERGVVLPPSA
jgi:shikimate 5-dehydrogenase